MLKVNIKQKKQREESEIQHAVREGKANRGRRPLKSAHVSK